MAAGSETIVATSLQGRQATPVTADRLSPRFAIDAQIVIQSPEGTAITSGRATNLSRGGLCAQVGQLLDRGARVDASIALVFTADSISEPLGLPARVVWCTSMGAVHQVGLQFLPLGKELTHYLDMFIRFLAGRDDGDDASDDAPARGAGRLRFDD